MKGHRLKAVLGLVLTILLLWWALRDVSPADVWREIERANPWLLVGAVAVATGSFVLRAIRWHVLLLPVRSGTEFRSRFGAVCIGFMGNNLLPARLGEFARAFALSRSESVTFSASLASLVVERVFDGFVLALFLAGGLLLGGPAAAGADDPGSAELVRRGAAVAFVALAAAFALLWLVARHPAGTIRTFEHTIGRLLGPTLSDRAVGVLAAFTRGLGALHEPAIFVRTLLWTVAVWVWLAGSIWLGLLAFGITAPGIGGAIFLQAVISLAVSIPSGPGFFGPFEAGVRLGLEPYGIAGPRIVGFAIAYHITTFIPVTLLGLWYLREFGLRWSQIEHGEELAEEAVEEEAAGEAAGGAAGGAAAPDRCGTGGGEAGAAGPEGMRGG